MTPGNDYIYWTFSAASQSIAAFVALLIAGYALVQAMMDSARERDDSLDEIHADLQTKYHKRLRELALLTGAAIVLSLLIVYLNRPGSPPSEFVLVGVATIDLAVVIFGISFVVAIIDPVKYRKAAEKALEESALPQDRPQKSSAPEFFDGFIHLERLIRNYLRTNHLYIPSRGAPKMSYSFRQMVEALRQNEVINTDFFSELLELNRYRNLVFHGHVDQVDSSLKDRVMDAALKFEKITRS